MEEFQPSVQKLKRVGNSHAFFEDDMPTDPRTEVSPNAAYSDSTPDHL